MSQRVIFNGTMSGKRVALVEWGPDVPGHHKEYSRCSGDAHEGEEQPMVSGYRLFVGEEAVDLCPECVIGKESLRKLIEASKPRGPFALVFRKGNEADMYFMGTPHGIVNLHKDVKQAKTYATVDEAAAVRAAIWTLHLEGELTVIDIEEVKQ